MIRHYFKYEVLRYGIQHDKWDVSLFLSCNHNLPFFLIEMCHHVRNGNDNASQHKLGLTTFEKQFSLSVAEWGVTEEEEEEEVGARGHDRGVQFDEHSIGCGNKRKDGPIFHYHSPFPPVIDEFSLARNWIRFPPRPWPTTPTIRGTKSHLSLLATLLLYYGTTHYRDVKGCQW